LQDLCAGRLPEPTGKCPVTGKCAVTGCSEPSHTLCAHSWISKPDSSTALVVQGLSADEQTHCAAGGGTLTVYNDNLPLPWSGQPCMRAGTSTGPEELDTSLLLSIVSYSEQEQDACHVEDGMRGMPHSEGDAPLALQLPLWLLDVRGQKDGATGEESVDFCTKASELLRQLMRVRSTQCAAAMDSAKAAMQLAGAETESRHLSSVQQVRV
jgi:hypothetical protein